MNFQQQQEKKSFKISKKNLAMLRLMMKQNFKKQLAARKLIEHMSFQMVM
jgi:hypothetical protein